MRYAEIVVNVPIGTGPQTFHYRIPPPLTGRLEPGHLVTVPFGPRPAQGIVVALSDTSPLADSEHKDVEGLVDETPVVTPAQIALARWIADYYLCSLLDALLLMLPPGLDQRAEPTYRLAKDATPSADLTDTERQLLDLVRTRASLDRRQMRDALTQTQAREEDLERLIRHHLVTREWHLPGPAIGPKVERVAYVIIDRQRVQAEIDRLRGPWRRRAAVLQALRDAGGPLPLESLVALADRSAVDSLASKDWLRVEETGVSLAANADAVDAETARLHATPRGGQTVALEVLLTHDGPMPFPDLYRVAPITLDNLRRLEAKGLLRIEEREVRRDPLAGRDIPLTEPPPLTPDQERVWQVIKESLQAADSRRQTTVRNPSTAACYLLHGVTGSGKTEIYLRALAEVVRQGRQAIVLVPEIALTPQTVHRFAARFPGRVAVLHSGLTPGQRYDEWRRVRAGLVDVVIGARSAIFAPLPSLGLIAVDEEHEPSYKQEETPRYHGRDAALKLAELTGAVVILGSATPAVETYRRAERGLYHLLELPQRIVVRHDRAAGSTPEVIYHELPPVEVVDMRAELKAGNRSIFSRALDQALRDTLRVGEQAILFLNRRGAATFVMCRDCGHVLRCRRCDVPLTYHEDEVAPAPSGSQTPTPAAISARNGGRRPPLSLEAGGEGQLLCHYCSRRYPQPARCPACGSPRIRYFGVGTQRVEAEVRKAYPQARLLRWDRDTATTGADHERFLDAFVHQQADVLIGTQMVAKGLDLPLVTLVGVISADTALHFPDFRSTERTFQLLAQVAGRAGRSSRGGRAVVQTYTPEHYAIQAASRHDYAAFYRQEIIFRREQGYPPFSQLARLVYSHSQDARAEAEARRMYDELHTRVRAEGLAGVDLIGPAPAYLHRLRGRTRWQIVVRAADVHPVLAAIEFGPGWSVDVDPVYLL